MGEFEDKLKNVVKKLSEEIKSDIIIFGGPLYKPWDQNLIKRCNSKTKYEEALLLLTTYGGDPAVAYRIARYLQRCYKKGFKIYIHAICKSAGTLLAVGADEIIMSETAEMGPLDVQMSKVDEIGEMSSGLTMTEAMNALKTNAFKMFEDYFYDLRIHSGMQISTKTASEIATNITVGLFSPIFSQIDPLRLGEIERAVKISIEYGERIGKKNLKDKALARLVAGYPDHGFVIDKKEAEDLFKKVREPSDLEYELADLVQPIVKSSLIKRDNNIVENLTELYLKEESEKENHGKNNNKGSGKNKRAEQQKDSADNGKV
jgi:Serine dehydrogenase proteinase